MGIIEAPISEEFVGDTPTTGSNEISSKTTQTKETIDTERLKELRDKAMGLEHSENSDTDQPEAATPSLEEEAPAPQA